MENGVSIMKIQDIQAREIFDSRGIPTIECNLFLSDGTMFTTSVPSGTSRGMYEAVELRDGGNRLMGLGVKKAVAIIEDIIAPALVQRTPDVISCDRILLELDQTTNKSHFGANTMLALSMAVCRAQAYVENMDLYELIAALCQYSTVALPSPMFNILGGGLHADNNFSIQEILIVPTKNIPFCDAMEIGITIFRTLKKILNNKNKIVSIGIEGNFVSYFTNEYEALDILMEAVYTSNQEKNIKISFDIAASHVFNHETKLYSWFGKQLDSAELIEKYHYLIQHYPIYSIEDGLEQTDWNGWHTMKNSLDSQVKLIGDDLFVTNVQRICKGIEIDCISGTIIKPNQIGTISETLQAVLLCKDNNLDVIVSHRSGETNDSFIADLAVGVSATHLKAGGCHNGERVEKYNRLMEIEDNLMVE